MSPRVWAAVGLSTLMNAFTMTPLAAQSGVEAEPVMAAFVQRFTQFVDWPAEAFADRDRFGICVAASGSRLQSVRSVVGGTEVDGRGLPIETREVDRADLDGCQVLFVSEATEGVEALVESSAGRPILTVSDGSGFLDWGGMIELRIVDRRIRFGVNAGSAAGAGLRISPQPLDLALEVRGARP